MLLRGNFCFKTLCSMWIPTTKRDAGKVPGQLHYNNDKTTTHDFKETWHQPKTSNDSDKSSSGFDFTSPEYKMCKGNQFVWYVQHQFNSPGGFIPAGRLLRKNTGCVHLPSLDEDPSGRLAKHKPIKICRKSTKQRNILHSCLETLWNIYASEMWCIGMLPHLLITNVPWSKVAILGMVIPTFS